MECPLCGATLEYYSDQNPQCPECKHVICDWMFEEARKKNEAVCCFITSDGKGCEKKAEYAIYYGTSPDDYTESCSSHIGELAGGIDRFEVFRIGKALNI